MKVKDFIPNKVFIGCPWKTIRPRYEKFVKKMEHKYPIYFVLIGREQDQRAEELLSLIKSNLYSSTTAIFDVTKGNPNVSLEYGIADAIGMEKVIYLNVHEKNKNLAQDSAIIADLAGQKRKQWKNEKNLENLLNEFSKGHTFTKRFETGFRKLTRKSTRHQKRTYRTLCLKVFRSLDGKEKVRRSDIVEKLQAENYDEDTIDFVLKGLRKQKLLLISTGRYAEVQIS